VTTHLHVHLEPNERKRRESGVASPTYESSEQLFTEHHPNNPGRLSASLADLGHFIREFHGEQRDQGVHYTELRLSPRRFRSLGFSLPDILMSADQAACKLENPEVRLILLLNRDSSSEFINECDEAISDGLPGSFVGVDLAGDEAHYADVAKFRKVFHKARITGLGVTIHAGEFGDQDSVWRAIDELGAERIGHGTAAAGCDALAARLHSDQILMEVSVTSNIALGAVSELESHPLPWFLDKDIPVCLNTDVPIHLGTNIDMEQEAARRILDASHQVLEAMEMSAQVKSFRDYGSRGSMPHSR
jgi:adenosine deaminase